MSAMAQATPQLPSQSEQNSQKGILELTEIAGAKLSAGDLAGAESDLQRIVGMEEFELSSDDFRARIHMLLGIVKVGLGEPELGIEYLDRAGSFADAMANMYWPIYFYAAMAANKMDKAIHAAATIAIDLPELMSSWDDEFVFALLRQTRDLPELGIERLTVLDALWRTGFTPKRPGSSMEYYFQELLDARIAEGDLEAAKLVADTLKGPDAIQQLSTNAAYAAYAPSDADAALAKAFEMRLRGLYQAAEDSPDLADPLNSLATWLNHAGRPEEALEILDGALLQVAEAPVGVAAFDDQAEELEWLHNNRSRTLMNLGRWDDALEAQINAQKVAKAADKDAVSQSVNLGEMYILVGKPELAAEVVSEADPDRSSEYGRMSIDMIKACAAKQLGKAVEAKALLSSMSERADDAPGPLFWAMLCADEIDGLAKLVSDRLEGLDTRRDALEFLQRFLLPDNQPEFFREMETRKDALRAHPLVIAALKDAGKIMEWPAYN